MKFYYRIIFKNGDAKEIAAIEHEIRGENYYFKLEDGSGLSVPIKDTQNYVCYSFEPIMV